MIRSPETFDVAIAGAGPAGSSAAIHLALAGTRVLLLEEKEFPRPKLCGEFISPECLAYFQRLGVADGMLNSGASTITKTVFYARTGHAVDVPSDWFKPESNAIGLSRSEMDQRLLNRAKGLGVTVYENARVTGLIRDNDRVEGIIYRKGDDVYECRARLTVDATGRTRALARHVERRHLTRSKQRLVAFKAHLANAQLEKGACEIYCYKGGYGGLSGVEEGLSNLCFIVAAGDVRRYNSDPDTVLREEVMKNYRAAKSLAEARTLTPWLSVSLESFGRRSVAPAPGLLTVGDAASFIDPFTGSGILMALENGQLLAQTISERLHDSNCLTTIAREYAADYAKAFRSRLRVAGLLRYASFVPGLAEATIVSSGVSLRLRRRLARATRGPSSSLIDPSVIR
jgi:flavin-dependent dehydrogenase